MKNIFYAFRGIANGLGDLVKALAVGLAVALAGVAQAAVETKNGVDWIYTDDGANATITAIGAIAPECDGFVNVPTTLGTYSVTTIGDGAFENCTDMTSLELPSSVTIIGKYAFRGCVNLASVFMSTYVTDIGNEAFKGCTSLTSVDVPYNATSIGTSVFEGCTSLVSVGFTGNVSSIPNEMFKDCTSLKNVALGMTSLLIIGDEAFRGCTALESFEVRDDVTTLGARAFHSCSALKEVTFWSYGTTSIGAGAFYGTTELKTIYVAEAMTATVKGKLLTSGLDVDAKGIKVKEISDVKYWTDTTVSPNVTWAFRTIGEATEVSKEAEIYAGGGTAIDPSDFTGPLVVPTEIAGNTVTRIGDGAFSSCSYLTSVTIPDGVKSIGGSAFSYCADLESVEIPNSVKNIGNDVFSGCAKLKSVQIPNGVTSIGANAFYGCTDLESVEIPASVTSIGANAFYGCTDLESVDIPDSVASIGEYAFNYCSGVTDLTLGKGVTSIGSYAFSGCLGLTGVSIPDGVTSIGDSAFSYCENLESVSIPDSVTNVGTETFMGCAKLADATLGSGLTSIPDCMFSDCALLTSVNIPYGVTSIGDNAFKGCALTRVEIPYGVTSIGASAFEDCTSLADATIPWSVTSIGNGAFKGCALKNVEIPDSVMSIGSQVFDECPSLEIVTLGSGVTVIPDYAFKGCASLASVDIPDGVTEIGGRAFKDCSALTSAAIPSSVTSIGTDAFAGTALSTVFVEDMVGESNITIALSGSGFDTSGITFVRADATPPHTVSFYGNGGNCAISSKTVYDGYAVGALPSATRAGYSFLGWFTAVEGGTEITETTIVNDDVACFAHWLADGCVRETVGGIEWTYRLVYGDAEICNGEDPAIPTSTPGIVDIPEKLGLGYWVTFIGTNAFNGCFAMTGVTIPEHVTTIRDGAFFDCAALTEVNIPASVAKIGNDAFNGCSALANLTMQEGVTSIGECAFNNCTALAEATIPATVTLIGDDAFSGCINLANLTIQDGVAEVGARAFRGCSAIEEVVVPDSVTNIGEEAFAYCGSLKKATLPIALKDTLDSSVFQDCHADFEIIYHAIYTVTFNANDGTATETSCKVDAFIPAITPAIGTLPEPDQRTGYDFDGWYTAEEGGDKIDSAYEVTADMTCYAHWTPQTFTITFDANGGEGGTAVTQDYGTALDAPTVTKEGHTLICWYPDVPPTVPAGDATYTAQWTVNTYTITFDANGGTGGWTNDLDYGFPLAAPTVEWEGHTFNGWLPTVPVAVPSENATYVAQWTVNILTVSLMLNADDASLAEAEMKVNYGDEIGELPEPTRPGHTFVGWFTAAEGGEKIESSAKVTAGMEIYAHWAEIVHTVTFEANGGTVSPTETNVNYGAEIGELPTPTWEGHDFVGWFTAETDGDEITATAVVTYDMICYAHWTEKGGEGGGSGSGEGEGGGSGSGEGGGTGSDSGEGEGGGSGSGEGEGGGSGSGEGGGTGSGSGEGEGGGSGSGSGGGSGEGEGGGSGSGSGGGSGEGESGGSGSGEGSGSGSGSGEGGGSGSGEGGGTGSGSGSGEGEGGGSGSGEGEGGGSGSGEGEGGGSGSGSGEGEGGGSGSGEGEGGGSGSGEGEGSGSGEGGADPTPTPDPTPEPEQEVIYGLYETLSGAVSTKAASEYNGYLADVNGVVKGTIQVKVAKPGKDGKASVKATVVLGKKKVSLKAKEKGKAVISENGPTAVELSGGDACEVLLGTDGILGFYGAYTIDGSRNFFTSKIKDEQDFANGILKKWLGTVLVFWDGGSLSVSIASKGKAKVSGTLVDGKTKVSANAVFLVGEEWCCIPVSAPKANLAFAIWLSSDGVTAAVKGLGKDVLLGRPGTLAANATFHVSKSAVLWASMSGTVLTDYLPDGVAVTQSGTKWTIPKAGKVTMKKGVLDDSKAGANPSGLKLTYKAKDGSFKGSFKVYADNNGKLKSTTVNVTGYVIDGVGYGTATVKKVGSVDVFVGE